MNIKIEKDADGLALFAVQVAGDDGQATTFTSLDVAYTIAQQYREVLVGANTYISPTFPVTCETFELAEEEDDLLGTMDRSGSDVYFDVDGIFVFKGEDCPNPDRAAAEFLSLHAQNKVVEAPSVMAFELNVAHIYVQQHMGNLKLIYLYENKPK
jgi:hypothetical protein